MVRRWIAVAVVVLLGAGLALAQSTAARGRFQQSGAGSSSALGPGATGTSLTLTPGPLRVGAAGISTDGGVVVVTAPSSLASLTLSGSLTMNGASGPVLTLGNNTAGGGNTGATLSLNADPNSINQLELRNVGDTTLKWFLYGDLSQTAGVIGPTICNSSANRGSITLSSGSGTATVLSGAKCVATDTSATPVTLRASLSGTTLTVSEATGTSTHVVNYLCF